MDQGAVAPRVCMMQVQWAAAEYKTLWKAICYCAMSTSPKIYSFLGPGPSLQIWILAITRAGPAEWLTG